MSKEQREQLIKLQDAASSLKNILQGWHKGLEPLEKNAYFAYGTMKTQVGGRDVTVQVIDVVAYLIQDALEQLKTANDLVKNGIEDLTVFDLTQLSNNVSIFMVCFETMMLFIIWKSPNPFLDQMTEDTSHEATSDFIYLFF